MKLMLVLIFLNMGLITQTVFGQQQSLDDQEIINVENLYKQSPPPIISPQIEKSEEASSQTEQQKLQEEKMQIKNDIDIQKSKIKSLTDLNKLAPFSDISVIQKKFLPKTGRLQLYTAGGLMTNSPWFINLGVKINLAYHFSESFGIEASGMVFTSTESEAAKEIHSNNNLQPNKFVNTKYNMILDMLWIPIYGKVTNLENAIIPFDMYFALGGGLSGANAQESTSPTFHIGTGQIFALSKSTAFRWDYSWNLYQATPEADSVSTSAPSKSNYNDLIFTAGVSFFFPEASYR